MRIAAYCRVSTGSEEQLESLKNQEMFFREYSQKHGYNLVNIYADEGISGKQASNRTQFLKMIADAEKNLFDMVVVKDISRFARNTVDFLNAVRHLKSINVEVQFLSNNQTILGNSEFILTIFSALAQEESANLSKRVKFGKRLNAKNGRVPNTIYGYDKIDTFKMAVNSDEAKIVKMIFDLYLKGYGVRAIALTLTELNIPTKLSRLTWTPKTIRRMLANPVYSGLMVNNLTESKDFLTGTKIKHTPDQYFYHQRPELKIITKEEFEEVQAQIEKRRLMYKNKNQGGRFSSRHIFSNLIHCSQCGSSYGRIVQTYKNTYIRWRCTGNNNFTSGFCDNNFKIDEQELVSEILEYFEAMVCDKDKFFSDLKKIVSKKNESASEINRLSEQLEKIERCREKFKSMYTNDIIDIEELKYRIKKLSEQESELRARCNFIKQAESENAAFDKPHNVQAVLNSNTLDNALLSEIVDKITVSKNGQVKIYIKNLCSQ